MRVVLSKPYLICWLAIPALVLIRLLFPQHTVDIQLYDTYFVIASLSFVLAGSVLLLLLGAGYWLVKLKGKMPNGMLTIIHLLLTVGVLLLVVLPVFNTNTLESGKWVVFSVIALFVGQLTYIVNILAALVRK
ncbi:hypothetical protein ACFQ4C_14045 [Larkinella insperata]|uniref:Integral membrane protein n=1 Tax=Larkinella insperata TaxID=332158 RepID=A0ABW3QJM5_9BACT|nr:hypothetical protein [Larkinella insperata]